MSDSGYTFYDCRTLEVFFCEVSRIEKATLKSFSFSFSSKDSLDVRTEVKVGEKPNFHACLCVCFACGCELNGKRAH